MRNRHAISFHSPIIWRASASLQQVALHFMAEPCKFTESCAINQATATCKAPHDLRHSFLAGITIFRLQKPCSKPPLGIVAYGRRKFHSVGTKNPQLQGNAIDERGALRRWNFVSNHVTHIRKRIFEQFLELMLNRFVVAKMTFYRRKLISGRKSEFNQKWTFSSADAEVLTDSVEYDRSLVRNSKITRSHLIVTVGVLVAIALTNYWLD